MSWSCTDLSGDWEIPRPVYPSMETPTDHRSDSAQQTRIRQRLAACRLGLQKLDLLRHKHRRLMDEMRNQLGLTTSSDADEANEERDPPVQSSSEQIPNESESVSGETVVRVPSPTPSCTISHRSSLSLDSGCLSLSSDPSSSSSVPLSLSRSQPTPFSNTYSPRKFSTELFDHAETPETPTESGLSDDEGCCLDSSPLIDSVIKSAIAASPKVGPRFRRKQTPGSRLSPPRERPRSLYNYPEENTVVVESLGSTAYHHSTLVGFSPPRSPRTLRPKIVRSESVQIPRPQYAAEMNVSSKTGLDRSPTFCTGVTKKSTDTSSLFRASCIFIDPEDGLEAPRMLPKFPLRRPQSIAWDPSSDFPTTVKAPTLSPLSLRPRTTWEDVKRMLDPLFENRRQRSEDTPRLVRRQMPEFGSCLGFTVVKPSAASIVTSPSQRRHGGRDNHSMLSRSVSSQSSDSNKSSSTTRRREKEWHESEQL